MLCFSRATVRSVPSTSLRCCIFADTSVLTLCSDSASDHPILNDSSPKPYCPHLRGRRMNRCSTVGSSGAEAPVLVRLCLDSNEASNRPTVSPLRPSVNPVLLTSLHLLCNSSGTSRNLTIGSSGPTDFAAPPLQFIWCILKLDRRIIQRCQLHFAYCVVYQVHRRLHRWYCLFIRR
jgi:hypothetical protein